jgi:hypothetical protein
VGYIILRKMLDECKDSLDLMSRLRIS